MFFSVEDKKMITERSKYIPEIYRNEMITIIESVINRTLDYNKRRFFEPISKEDYD